MRLSAEALEAIEESEAWIDEIGKGTGWKPEPEDERDFKAKSLLGSTAPPPRASLRQHTPPVRDQRDAGSCVGFAVAAGIGTLARKPADTHWETIYSPLHIYNLARMAIGELHLDEGCYIRHGVGAARKAGVAREADFPYYELTERLHIPPTPKALESAKSFRLGSHYRCSTLNDVKRAIAQGYPVVFGFLVYSNIGQAASSGLVPEPSGSILGGHAVLAAAYDDANRRISALNSWGPWGDKGWIHLPYSFFETGRTSDMWALVDEAPETQYPRKAT
jgi:C1A family cysteine protease